MSVSSPLCQISPMQLICFHGSAKNPQQPVKFGTEFLEASNGDICACFETSVIERFLGQPGRSNSIIPVRIDVVQEAIHQLAG